MCSGLAGERWSSCSGPRPPLLPGAYCKCVQDETPNRKHFLPVPVSQSTSSKGHGGCGEFAFAWVWSAGGHGRDGQGVWAVGTGPLGLQRCGTSWFEILVLVALGYRGPEQRGVKVPVCWQVGRWGDAFRRDENSSLRGFFSENWPADSRVGLGSRKPVSGRLCEEKGCARLLGPGLSVH